MQPATKPGKFPSRVANKMSGLSSKDHIKEAVEVLKNGGIVFFPTDTVYGIGCRFDDKDAVLHLSKIKKTPIAQRFPVLVSTTDQVRKYAQVTKQAENLIKKY